MSNSDQLKWFAINGLSRREFMSRTAALGASTAIAASLANTLAVAQSAPVRGGHLKLGINGAASTDSLDPATYTSNFTQTVGYQWGNCLVELNEKVEAVPELAETWEPNADATQWVFKLRKGVVFHNGKEMTAADIVHSINHHRGKDSKSAAKVYLEPISDIKATDKHEVTVTVTSANVDLPYIMADYHLLIMPEGAAIDSAIGTGGYTIEVFEPGVRSLAKRSQNYWKKDRGHVDSVETLAINDLTARTIALQTGAVHHITRIDPKNAALLDRDSNIEIINVPGASHYVFPMRTDTSPFDKVDLRLALKYAIDRQEVVDKILRGFGKIGNDHPIPAFDPFYADLPQHAYDPDKAKHHFQKAGIDGPLTLYISDAAFTGAVDTAILYKAQAAKAGITLNVERTPEDGYWNNVWLQKPFCGGLWDGRPTANLMLSVAYQSDAPWNETFWKREKFDELLIKARGELDFGKRKQMYHDMQEMIWQDGGAIIPVFNNFILAQHRSLKGFVESPVLIGRRVAEQVFFGS